MRGRLLFAVLVGNALMLSSATHAAAAVPPSAAQKAPSDAPKYDPDEPLAKTFSLEKSADYLDAIAAFWLKKSEAPKDGHQQHRHSCGACHANFAYMMARPLLLKEKPLSLLAETRRCMEQHVATLDPAKHTESGRYHLRGAGPTLAAGLVFHDLHSGGELRPTTRQALDKMWTLQRPEKNQDHRGGQGPWYQSGFCWDLSAPELDGDYSTILAALAVGTAPDGYARGDSAKQEITQLREYVGRRFNSDRADLAKDLHAQALCLWASCRLDGLLSPTKREAVVRSLLAAQCSDGGWSLAQLGGRWHGGSPKESDGYATGLVVYVLRQAGLPAKRPEIARGVAWLKNQQRASGGWFTPNADRSQTVGGIGTHDLAILNLGTAFAVMALHASENTPEANRPRTEAKASALETPVQAP